MSAEFTPLLPSVKSRLGSSSGGTAPPFAPMNTSNPSASNPAHPGTASSKPDSGFPPSASPSHGTAHVQVMRDGERISQIRVECRCGEVIDLICEY